MRANKVGLGSLTQKARTTKAVALDHAGRVKSIILNESHPRFEEAGGYTAIGTVEFEPINKLLSSIDSYPLAKPIYTNIKQYPVVGEIIYLLRAPSLGLETSTQDKITYYINVVNIWGSIHQNARPSSIELTPPASQNNGYEYVAETGISNVQNTELIPYSLGQTFEEKDNINPLQPFEGDVIYEGRWGNSIRLASTTVDKGTNNPVNNWSTGEPISGDPITIIRNGQSQTQSEGWIPIQENINTDQSSLYLTTTQRIPIQRSALLPSFLNIDANFQKPQILLNSDRINLNSKNDSTILTSNKSIVLSAQQYLTLTTRLGGVVVDSSNIKLGGSANDSGYQPALKGDDTVDILKQLVSNLSEVMKVLEKLAIPGVSGTDSITLASLNQAATQARIVLTSVLPVLDTLTSKIVYLR